MINQHENNNYKHPITSIKFINLDTKDANMCSSTSCKRYYYECDSVPKIITRTIRMTSITSTRHNSVYGSQKQHLTLEFVVKPQNTKMILNGLFYLICEIHKGNVP